MREGPKSGANPRICITGVNSHSLLTLEIDRMQFESYDYSWHSFINYDKLIWGSAWILKNF